MCPSLIGLVAQSCLILFESTDCSPAVSSVHRILGGLPFPPPGNLPNPGVEPMSPASPALQVIFFTIEQWGNAYPLKCSQGVELYNLLSMQAD